MKYLFWCYYYINIYLLLTGNWDAAGYYILVKNKVGVPCDLAMWNVSNRFSRCYFLALLAADPSSDNLSPGCKFYNTLLRMLPRLYFRVPEAGGLWWSKPHNCIMAVVTMPKPGEEDVHPGAWRFLQYSISSATGPDAVGHEGMAGCCSVLSTVMRIKRSLVWKMKEHASCKEAGLLLY